MTEAERQILGRDVLKRVSRSFYLSLVLLPQPMREPLSLGYLLARASDTIADAGAIAADQRRDLLAGFRQAVTSADTEAVKEVRLQLRSSGGLTDEGEIELIERLPDCLQWLGEIGDEDVRAAIVEVLEVITAGQAWDIERFECGDANEKGGLRFCSNDEEITDYTYRVAGCVGEFWTRVGFLSGVDFADDESHDELMAAGRRYGQGLQLVNIVRDLGGDLKTGRCYLPHDALRLAGWRDEEPWTVEGNRRAILAVAGSWRKTAGEWLAEGDAYADLLKSRRVRLATRLPARLGLRTLGLFENAGLESLDHRVKISRGVVWRELFACLLK